MDTLITWIDQALGLSETSAFRLGILQVSLRAVVVFAVLLFYVRIAKKRFLGRATAFDAILVIIIGSVASRAVSGTAPFVPTLAGTLVLILVHWLLSLIASNSRRISGLIKGHDTLLVRDGRIDTQALHDAHMSMDDLTEDLRSGGACSADDVAEARLERSGRVSVIKKSGNS